MSKLTDNYAAVAENVRRRAEAAGRPGAVKLLTVSKTRPTAWLRELYDAGVRAFAENRVPELERKVAELPTDIEWHFIGPLQSNKVRKVVKLADVIHSVESLELLERLDRIAGEEGRRPEVYLEVNVSGELSKGGVSPGALPELAAASRSCRNLRVAGLMTMAPLEAGPEELRRIFGALRELAGQHGLTGLSMGMSGDYEYAIDCGSTLVRVGSRIFEGVES